MTLLQSVFWLIISSVTPLAALHRVIWSYDVRLYPFVKRCVALHYIVSLDVAMFLTVLHRVDGGSAFCSRRLNSVAEEYLNEVDI